MVEVIGTPDIFDSNGCSNVFYSPVLSPPYFYNRIAIRWYHKDETATTWIEGTNCWGDIISQFKLTNPPAVPTFQDLIPYFLYLYGSFYYNGVLYTQQTPPPTAPPPTTQPPTTQPPTTQPPSGTPVCQAQNVTGNAACQAKGMTCVSSNCGGGCTDYPSSPGNCGCTAICSGTPSTTQPPTTQPPTTQPPTTRPPTTQPPTTQPPTTQPPTTQPPTIQCDPNTQINIPSIGCVPRNYLIYGGVGLVALMLLKK